MSRTWEEAIYWLDNGWRQSLEGKYREVFDMAISALRPVSREQVEKVWRGEWELYGAGKNGKGGIFYCTRCEKSYPYKCDFCPRCGAPMTDEAVQMVMERLEALYEDSSSV